MAHCGMFQACKFERWRTTISYSKICSSNRFSLASQGGMYTSTSYDISWSVWIWLRSKFFRKGAFLHFKKWKNIQKPGNNWSTLRIMMFPSRRLNNLQAGGEKGVESVAHYILRNTFSLAKLSYIDKTGTVIYRSKMSHGGNKRNFQAFPPPWVYYGNYSTHPWKARPDGQILVA